MLKLMSITSDHHMLTLTILLAVEQVLDILRVSHGNNVFWLMDVSSL
jgi:hypothetical protein